jgi:RNA recognition motif-containing protein
MNIYVGNLSYTMTEDEVRNLFSEFGQVESIKLIRDHESQRSRGFAFVEMALPQEANNAIKSLNGFAILDRKLVVNQARPKANNHRPGGGGGDNRRRQYA